MFLIINLNACENQTGTITKNEANNSTLKTKSSKKSLSNPYAVFGFSKVDVGYLSTCGIFNNNAYCWGNNNYGQLGNGSTTNSSSPVAIAIGGSSAIPSGNTISQISVGFFSSCAIDNSGVAYCWGSNDYGQLGNGSTKNSSLPIAVAIGGDSAIPSGSTILQISSGAFNTCAIASNHKAYCWGANWYGQLGNGTTTSSSLPVEVTIGGNSAIPNDSTILQISTNEYNTCAIASNHKAYCWGVNWYGQLGNGTTTNSSLPVEVTTGGNSAIPSDSTISEISNNGMNNCAIDNHGVAYCWGNNDYGQLGNGTTTNSSLPVAIAIGGNSAIPSGSSIVQITGLENTCAISSDNKVYCWGNNNYGEVGNGTTVSSSLPIQVIMWANLINNSGYNEINSVALSLAFFDDNLLLGNSNTPGVAGFRHVWQLNNGNWTNLSNSWSNYITSAPTAILPVSNTEVIVGHFNGSVQDCNLNICNYLIHSQGSSGLGVTSLLHINHNYFIGYSTANQDSSGKLVVYQESGSPQEFNVTGIDSGVGKITTDNSYVYAPTQKNGVLKISLDGINSVDITPIILQNNEFVTVLRYVNNTLYAGTSLANIYKVALPINNGDTWIKLTKNSLSSEGYISDIAVDNSNNLYVGLANLFNPTEDGSLYLLKNNDSKFLRVARYNDYSSITSLLLNNNHLFVATYAGNIWQN